MVDILLFVLYAIGSFIISGAVHELGHILTGLMEGFKFYLFIVGPFGFKRNENSKVKFYIEKNVSLWGGLGATIPLDEDINNFKKFGHVLLGGPIASMAFGAIWLPLGIKTDNLFLMLLGSMPLGMGIASLIPVRNGAFYTDGGRWLRMFKNEDTKPIELAIWNITQTSIVHSDFAKVNLKDIEVLKNNQDLRTKYLGHYYAYCFYKDTNDIAKMEKEKIVLTSLKEKVPKQVVSMFRFD